MPEKLICLVSSQVTDWEIAPFETLIKPLRAQKRADLLYLKSGLPSKNFLKAFKVFWIVAKNTEEINTIAKRLPPHSKIYVSLLSLEKEQKKFGVMNLFSPSLTEAHYLAHSELSYRFLKEVQKKSEVTYFPLPVPKTPANFSRKYSEKLVVGTLGWFSSSFDLNYFLLVAHYVLQHRKDIWFRVLGEGPLKGHARKLIEELGLGYAVEICDFIEPEELADLDLFIFSPLRNDNDISLLWPAVFSIPVLATSVPGIESFISDGKTGYLVPVHETKPMAELILRFLDHEPLRKAFGEAYRQKLMEQFNLEALQMKSSNLFSI